MAKKLSSVTAFFPAYNDGGTIASMVVLACRTLAEITDDYEVIVVNDGSSDSTAEVLETLVEHCPHLRIITHPKNRGYGGALRSGFAHATKDWVFYTDGDAQYDPRELLKLVEALNDAADNADVVNGYKISRNDPWERKVIGWIYHHTVKFLFGLPLRDTDCDFRLIRRSLFDRVRLKSDSGTIALELVKKFHDAGCRFVEVPVHHYHRSYGTSQFFNFRRVWRTGVQLLQLWYELVLASKRSAPPATVRQMANGRRLSALPWVMVTAYLLHGELDFIAYI